jgi:hypothetical protein
MDVQVLGDVGQLPRLNEEIGVVDEGDGAEGAGVVLGAHPAAVEHAPVEKELLQGENEQEVYLLLGGGGGGELWRERWAGR